VLFRSKLNGDMLEIRIRYGPVYRIRQRPSGFSLVATTLLATYP
jgi:hypothetical protein